MNISVSGPTPTVSTRAVASVPPPPDIVIVSPALYKDPSFVILNPPIIVLIIPFAVKVESVLSIPKILSPFVKVPTIVFLSNSNSNTSTQDKTNLLTSIHLALAVLLEVVIVIV